MDATSQKAEVKMPPPFEALNKYAHRRQTINIGNPAIIWHRAYWKPEKMSDDNWHKSVNEIISNSVIQLEAGLFSKFSNKNNGDTELNADDSIDFKTDSENRISYRSYAKSATFRKNGLAVTIQYEKFDEFWSSKTVIDYSKCLHVRKSPDELYDLFLSLDECVSIIIDRYNDNNFSDKFDLNDRPFYPQDVRRKNDDNVMLRCSDVISKALRSIDRMVLGDYHDILHDSPCCSDHVLFANFVGLSLGINISERFDKCAKIRRRKSRSVLDNVRPGRLFSELHNNTARLVSSIWPAAKIINPYVRYLDCGDEYRSSPETTRREFTMSFLSRRRALYVTSLGGMDIPADSGVYFPLSYLLICPHRATWQIGRIIDRIHTIGLFRLASLRDYDKIESANDRVRILINHANSDISAEKIYRSYQSINSEFSDGLQYRIAWSKYYKENFFQSVKMLDFERVEGYQKYDEFINRRLGQKFEIIDSSEKRLEYLMNLLNTKFNFESRRENRKTMISIGKTGNQIAGLLDFADQISVMPVGYYSYHVFVEVNNWLVGHFNQIISIRITTFWLLIWGAYAIEVWIFRRYTQDIRIPYLVKLAIKYLPESAASQLHTHCQSLLRTLRKWRYSVDQIERRLQQQSPQH